MASAPAWALEDESWLESWLFSIVATDSATQNVPALLPTEPEKMIEGTKANGLMVPFAGYWVYVIGASPAGQCD